MWSGVLDDTTVENLITECEKYSVYDATIGTDGTTQNDNYRNSEVRWIGGNSTPSSLLWNYAKEANRNAFGFDIDYLKDIQFTTYNASDNGKYDWHHDTFWGNPSRYDRKISVVIQLSDPEDYEGGEFVLCGEPLEKKKGSAVVFPSNFMFPHEVQKVTSGDRYSIMTWIL